MKNKIDKQREEKLVSDNLGLIISRAKMFKPHSPELLDEYIQIGRIGLLKAIRKHNPSRGSLSTIAYEYIGWEIMRHINKTKKKVPTESLQNNYAQYITKTELWEILPDTLTDKERKIIEYRYQGLTFKEIGYELGGLTRGWANKLFKTAIQKIRDANEEKTHTNV